MNNFDKWSMHHKLALSIILSDCFTYNAIIKTLRQDLHSYFWLGITPYVALTVNEADNWFKKTRIADEDLSVSTKKHVELLRGKSKFYSSDSLVDYPSHIAELKKIHKEHIEYFTKSLRFKWQKKVNLYYDFGTYKANGNYIGNTLLFSWYYPSAETEGIPIFDTKISYDIAYSIGQFFGKVLSIFDEVSFTFSNVANGDGLKITNKDHNLNYGFFPNQDYSYKMLFNLLCAINFVLLVVNFVLPDSNWLKLRINYLAYYYCCESVQIFNKTSGLTIIMPSEYCNREFRNCMAHYGLGQAITVNEVINDVPFYGLVEKHFKIDYKSLLCNIIDNLSLMSHELANKVLK